MHVLCDVKNDAHACTGACKKGAYQKWARICMDVCTHMHGCMHAHVHRHTPSCLYAYMKEQSH